MITEAEDGVQAVALGEHEILLHLARGRSRAEIATELNLSETTVRPTSRAC